MAIQFVINILIAIVWMFLQDSYGMPSFLFGFIIGLLILFTLRRFMEFDFYFIKVIAFVRLVLLFLFELVKANIDVVRVVLRPKLENKPGIIAVDTSLETDFERATLAALITLTPGTVSMDFSADSKTIYVHKLNVDDRDQMVAEIKNSFEKAIKEVTK
ncbi:Na+/H+ antiporter subunit E [Lacicoccus alkaliphilus]|uniref:Multisubunit sodium/proton antiporter, MrpE subunit n=1 Tax=Lacicoccus alkaliphilus DSM 16010 TaxID=1123231 RepID=A0A1M7FK30_9BACL|nr:Na+/H+ antiporter subunit E [Salinicoccus alkaliphilus]SHM04059.1 multisubunit sodium/proton antiporter, MrpE subunit [Salinicoccus alkaliphilus DSM 16010]